MSVSLENKTPTADLENHARSMSPQNEINKDKLLEDPLIPESKETFRPQTQPANGYNHFGEESGNLESKIRIPRNRGILLLCIDFKCLASYF